MLLTNAFYEIRKIYSKLFLDRYNINKKKILEVVKHITNNKRYYK